MIIRSRKAYVLFTFLTATLIVSLDGCKNPSASELDPPRIHSVGSGVILNFSKGDDISIPIEGQNLNDPKINITASVEGPFSLSPETDYYLDNSGAGTSSSLIFLKINKSAATNLNSKDHLLVNVTISERHVEDIADSAANQLRSLPGDTMQLLAQDQIKSLRQGIVTTNIAWQLGTEAALAGSDQASVTQLENWLHTKDTATNSAFKDAFDSTYNQAKALSVNVKAPHQPAPDAVLSSDSRTFILFTPEDYRSEVLADQLEIQNITAFPLPESETRKLFGDLVATKFYAVRLTLRNPTSQDQIVSLGLIKAYGRALVEPKPAGNNTRYTIPIEVAPQSQQQVYTMVQSPKGFIFDSDEPGLNPNYQAIRDWFFGTLEFAGAMASAYGTGFGASEDYLKAVSLATGAGIPGLDKLWADKRPFYLLNVVNFAMPDLVKVPRGGSIDGKYLFFSKGQLQAILQDPHVMQISQISLKPNPSFEQEQFFARVVYLEFDDLQIPFENTSPSSEATNLASQVEVLKSTAATLIAEYNAIKSDWPPSGGNTIGRFSSLNWTDFTNLQTSLLTATAKTANIPSAQYAGIDMLKNMLVVLQTNADSLTPSYLSTNLCDSADYGVLKLMGCVDQLQNVETGLLQGQPDSLFQGTVDNVSHTINTAQNLLSYSVAIAEDFQANSPWTSVTKIGAISVPTKLITADISNLDQATNNFNVIISKLPTPPVLK